MSKRRLQYEPYEVEAEGEEPPSPPNKRRRIGSIQEEDPSDAETTWVDDDTLENVTVEQEHPAMEEDSESEEEQELGPYEKKLIEYVIKLYGHMNPDELEDAEPDLNKRLVIQFILKKYNTEEAEPEDAEVTEEAPKRKPRAPPKPKIEKPPIKLTKVEETYYKSRTPEERKILFDLMTDIANFGIDNGDIPYKFRLLKLPISDYLKSNVLKKITALADMGTEGGGDSYKLKTWIDAFFRIPFGKTIPLPVRLEDGRKSCTDFMNKSMKFMDTAVYGMKSAKTHVMQIIAQWIVNPTSVGNVLALQGPMGVGKTGFAKNVIAKVLDRPFRFFSLGGASDIANFVGHSFTYEGSMWGRIADSIMQSKCMNPVMYFDEVDKISTTSHGQEIVSMLIHLTDRTQNSHFHDRYFSGVDLDLSQCLFVFSFNDIENVHPILRDRMTVIKCPGYNETDKKEILKNHIWPQMMERLNFTAKDVTILDSAITFLINEYSSDEKGVRCLIRAVETMMTRLNMLRVSDRQSMQDYKFYMDFATPFVITESVVKKLLTEYNEKEVEHWRSLYT